MMGCLEILSGLAVIIALLYYYLISSFDFWKSRGVPGPKPIPFYGTLKNVLLKKQHMSDYATQIYKKYKEEPMVGIFEKRQPILILHDPDLIKTVLIKDFSQFSDRGELFVERPEPLTAHLFRLETKRWRPLRMRFSPVFTSGKLKDMFGMIVECSNLFEKYIEQILNKSDLIEVRELTAKFTTDVIGNCAFGIDTQSLAEEESEFRRMGKHIFAPEYFSNIRVALRIFFPKFYNVLGHVIPYEEKTKFFFNLTTNTIKYRREKKIVRNDFVNILMELQDHPEKVGDVELTDELIAAQAFVFFAAGFETSSTTVSNALYELALHQDIQEKLREEINDMYADTNGDLQYQTVKSMSYLDRVFRETLRKYPPVSILTRQAVSNYTFKNTNNKVSIPKGQKIWIPVYAFQRDPSIYPNPEEFDPERFTEEVAATRNPMHYLPFGDGPRNCVGARFAVFQTKIGIIKIIRNYKVEACDKTPIPYKYNTKTFLLSPAGGIHLKFTRLTENTASVKT